MNFTVEVTFDPGGNNFASVSELNNGVLKLSRVFRVQMEDNDVYQRVEMIAQWAYKLHFNFSVICYNLKCPSLSLTVPLRGLF